MINNISTLNQQKGVVVVVVLVVLIAMTFLGLGAMSDTNIQLAMVRNSQLQNIAHNAAMTEINAQLFAINSNEEGATDTIIVNMLQSEADPDLSRTMNAGENTFNQLLDDIIGAAAYNSYYTSDVLLYEPDTENIQPAPGNTIDPDFPIKMLRMEFRSTVTVNNTNTTSSQIQGFNYPAAN